MKRFSPLMFALLLMSSLLVSFSIRPVKTDANTIIVPDDYQTIQEAINHANEGDTIFVRNGTHSGPIVIDKTLILRGENRNATIVDGGTNEPSGSIVLVVADNVKISGFTIQHCREGGNAIWIDGYVNMTFSRNIITGNNEGIRILHSFGNIISYNIIRDCYYNAGLGLNWAYNNIVYRNILENNNVGIGGNHWNNIFFENVIKDNEGGWAGWGISDNFYDCVFYHNNIINNGDQVYNTNPNSSIWNNSCEGNYWSDYNGTDLDGDGIGDTPYIINSNNQDNYPLMHPYWNAADANHDLKVDGKDIAILCKAFDTKPGNPNWNPHADLNSDGKIDGKDIGLVAKYFDAHYP